ncbi:MAG: putative phosphohydrolase, Icc family [Devosia sp.]|nr:putative phosphohydrolase, Icc family [Devosia sp.]
MSHFLATPDVAITGPMISIAHISDIHLAPLPKVKPWELLNKRITGYLNWKLKRQRDLNGEGLVALVSHLRAQEPDLVMVTGDLVNVALDAEIVRAHGWLRSLGPEERVCISPGNHDSYVPGAFEKARKRWAGYVDGERSDPEHFPYVRKIGDVAVISCSSSVPTPPWMASGLFSEGQAARLASLLTSLGREGYFRVVLIHHPPNVEADNFRLGLHGARRFRRVIKDHGAELILHGHTHRSSIHTVPGPTADVPVIGVAAAGARIGDPVHDPARYNLFRIEKHGDAWSCVMREFGYQRIGSEIVMRLQMRIY